MAWECLKQGGGGRFAPDEKCIKDLYLGKKKSEPTFFVDLLSYLSCQMKWYEHKSLLAYFVDEHRL